MSNRELIAEARMFTGGWDEEVAKPRDIGSAMELIDRLAAAMEAMELPEGWRWTEATREDGAYLKWASPGWAISGPGGNWIYEDRAFARFPTAREAMAALDGKDG